MAGQQTITAVVAADARPFKKGMTDAGNSTSNLTKGLKNLAVVGAASLAALAVGAVAFGFEALKAADQARQISKGLETAVKNSKAFGANATEIKKVTEALDEHSTKLGELIGVDDEVLSGIKRNWLSVGNIARTGTTQINKLAGVAADVAAGTGKELEAVANAFTKAYGDPKGALGKLTKAGVILTEQEQKRYQLLIDTGKETEALSFLTATLETKFKGAAEAAASPFARLQVSLGNFQEKVGGAFLPLLDEILPDLQKALSDLAVDPKFQQSLKDIAGTLKDALPAVIDFIKDDVPVLVDFLKNVSSFFGGLAGWSKDNENFFAGMEGWLEKNVQGKFTPQGSIADQNLRAVKSTTAQTNITINASSVNTSAATGQAVATALDSYFRTKGTTPTYIAKRGPGR